MCFILLLLMGLIPLFAAKGPELEQCPPTHPYAYHNGDYCCQNNREKVYSAGLGKRCDGGPIGWESYCCNDNAYKKCTSPPCVDSRSLASGQQCPSSYPNVYNNGKHCCKYDQENVYTPHGKLCDGGHIGFTSLCCKNDEYITCKEPRCSNYSPGDQRRSHTCPWTYPYAYWKGGQYCCEWDMEKYNSDGGWQCDGGPIGLSSLCCKEHAHTECPHSKCSDFHPAGGNQCPTSHPYAYWNGDYCCKHDKEKHSSAYGELCDGGTIGVTSLCCKDDAHIRCKNRQCIDAGDCDDYCSEITNDEHELVKVDYHLDEAEELPQDALRPVAKQTVDNTGGSVGTFTDFTVSLTEEERGSWTHTTGSSIGSSITFSAGIPYVGDMGFSVDFSVSEEHTTGGGWTSSKTLTATFRCTSPPRTLTVCKAYLSRVKINVPYTQTWAPKKHPRCACTTDGIFKGDDAQDLYMLVNEEKDRIAPRIFTKTISADGYVAADTDKLE